jgi:acyl-CoA reductase-like NAD-dependent aldehyde dehydrogenase
MSTSNLAVKNPRTGQVDFTIEAADPGAVQALASRARSAQPAWQALGLEGRAQALLGLQAAITRHFDAIHAALAEDTGRSKIARREIEGALASLGGWAAQAPHLLPTTWTAGRFDPRMAHAPQWVPSALVGVISPWNFPLAIFTGQIVAALMAGNAVIAKPAEQTPLIARVAIDLMLQAGIPPSALTLLQGCKLRQRQRRSGGGFVCVAL